MTSRETKRGLLAQIIHLLEAWERARCRRGWLSGLGPSTADSGSCVWTKPGPSATEPVVNQPGACISARTKSHTHSATRTLMLHIASATASATLELLLPPLLPSDPSGCSCGWQIRLQKDATTAHALCAPPHHTVCPGCLPIGIQEASSKPTCLDCRKAPPALRSSLL